MQTDNGYFLSEKKHAAQRKILSMNNTGFLAILDSIKILFYVSVTLGNTGYGNGYDTCGTSILFVTDFQDFTAKFSTKLMSLIKTQRKEVLCFPQRHIKTE